MRMRLNRASLQERAVTEDQFWTLIEAAHAGAGGNQEAQMTGLEVALRALPLDACLEFQRHFDRKHRESYRAHLWGAAFIMNGGASDDGFDYFRGWLIAQGRAVYTAALADPDSLVDCVDDDAVPDFGYENEDMLSVAGTVWRAKTGGDWDAFYDQAGSLPQSDHELGDLTLWSVDGDADKDKCRRIYPKLWQKFGS
jgi:Protein of unknown function (DUF4240)